MRAIDADNLQDKIISFEKDFMNDEREFYNDSYIDGVMDTFFSIREIIEQSPTIIDIHKLPIPNKSKILKPYFEMIKKQILDKCDFDSDNFFTDLTIKYFDICNIIDDLLLEIEDNKNDSI